MKTNKRLILMLVLLIAAVTSTWAQDPDPTIPVKQSDGSWTFTMPAANKLLAVEYFPPVLTLTQTDNGTVELVNKLTVNDGTKTNNVIPVYTGDFAESTKSQHIIPAAQLSTMTGAKIKSLKYYIRTQGTVDTWTSNVNVDVYLKEVTNTTIDVPIDKVYCTTVYTGTISRVDAGDHAEMTITFSTPYTYQGYNLLVGFENLATGGDQGCKTLDFLGVAATGASIGGANNPSQENFLPKTTFTYEIPGVTDNGNGTYYVESGTALTVKATPDDLYYLSGWLGTDPLVTTETYSFTMGDADKTVSATFAKCPVLTVASNGATYGTADVAADKDKLVATFTTTQTTDQGWKFQYPSNPTDYIVDEFFVNSNEGDIYFIPELVNGTTDYSQYKFIYYGPDNNIKVVSGTYPMIKITGSKTYEEENWDNATLLWNGGISKVEVYTPGTGMPEGVTEYLDANNNNAVVPGKYYVKPGTEVPVEATPKEGYCLTSWTEDTAEPTAASSFTAATKTFTMGTADKTVTATFAACSVLTLASAPENSGSVVLVMSSADKQSTLATNTGENTYAVDGVTVNVNIKGDEDGAQIQSGAPMTIATTDGGNISSVVLKIGYYSTNASKVSADRGTCEVSGTGNHNTFVTITGINAPSVSLRTTEYVVFVEQVEVSYVSPVYPEGVLPVANDNDPVDVENTYYVVPGTEVALRAVPAEGYHLDSWSTNVTVDTEDKTLATVTVSDAITVTATFAENPVLTLAVSPENSGSVEIVKQPATVTESFTANKNNLVTQTQGEHIGITATTVDDYGWYINGENSIIIQSLNGETITGLRLHFGTGSYYANTTSSTAGTVNAVSGSENATVTEMNATSVTLTSSSNENLTINQITVYFDGYVLPNGVTATETEGVYHVTSGTELTLKATPAAGNYVQKWKVDNGADEAVNSISATKTITMANADKSVKATFAACPVLTIASNDAAMGSVEVPLTLITAEITTEMLSGWIDDEGYVSLGELPGFISISDDEAKTWTGAPDSGSSFLIYSYENGQFKTAEFDGGTFDKLNDANNLMHDYVARNITDENSPVRYFYPTWNNAANVTVKDAEAGQYYVVPNSSVKINATAAANNHVAGWTDGAATPTAYTSGISNSNYRVTSTSKYPAKSQLVLTMGTTAVTAQANFAPSGYSLTIPAGEFVTLYSADALTLTDDDMKLCTIAEGGVGENAATATVLTGVASKETPLLVWNNSTAEKTVFVSYADEPATATAHADEFQGTLTDKTFTADEMDAYKYYICNGTKFIPVTTAGTIAANRCWLELPPSNARPLTIVFDGELTSINSMVNGQSSMDTWHDLSGRKFTKKPTKKGVYIVGQRTVVVK